MTWEICEGGTGMYRADNVDEGDMEVGALVDPAAVAPADIVMVCVGGGAFLDLYI